MRGRAKRGAPAKAKGTAVTLAALLQYGSGMAAYMSRMPHLEYSETECDTIARAASDALGTMSSKKSKAVIAFLNQWSPWITFGGVMIATTLPRVQQTRAVLAQRRQEKSSRAIPRTGEQTETRSPAPESVALAGFGVGGEGGTDVGGGSTNGAEIGARGLGFDS